VETCREQIEVVEYKTGWYRSRGYCISCRWTHDLRVRRKPRQSSRIARARRDARPRHLRGLDETLADALAWEMSREHDRVRQAGLSDEDERALLEALAHA